MNVITLITIAFAFSTVLAEDVAAPIPSPAVDAAMQKMLEDHQAELHDIGSHTEARVSFTSVWVSQSGITSTKPSVPAIEVQATTTTQKGTLDVGAKIVFNLMKHMHPNIFSYISRYGSALGIFSYYDQGGITVFPEYAHLADRPECKGICTGNCAVTCTFDGRKYDTLAGVGGTRAVVTEDNVLCNSRDPYYGKLNVAVHEFTHSLHSAISSMTSPFNSGITFGKQISNAYNNAKTNRIWDLNSYAMANDQEYWAEAAGVYFNVDQNGSTGGMEKCDGVNLNSCKTEMDGRYRLYSKDALLYNALTEVYVNRDPNKASGLKTCMTK